MNQKRREAADDRKVITPSLLWTSTTQPGHGHEEASVCDESEDLAAGAISTVLMELMVSGPGSYMHRRYMGMFAYMKIYSPSIELTCLGHR